MALLFVVSLILFITLLGTSFVVVSQQFSASAKNRARIEATGDSSRAYVYRAFYDLVRGPDVTNANSPLFANDILSDEYGYGLLGSNAVVANGAVSGTFSVNFAPVSALTGLSVSFSPAADAYNGRVLTLIATTGFRISTRVVDFDPLTGTFTVLPATAIPNSAVLGGSDVVLNGPAFGGWGGGGVIAGGVMGPEALLPRLSNDNALATLFPTPDRGNYVSSGVNESYDALDYQNTYLAMFDGTEFHASFNRPQLFNHLVATYPGDDRAKFANFRPYTAEYVRRVNAAGGNPTAVPVNQNNGWASPNDPLDVDNDGDGVADSIWMDVGYPIQTDVDGRRFKPLVAYMVVDMDNRLNVNAHGNGFHINRNVNYVGNLLGGIDPISNFLPRGQYLGPPEVSLGPLVGNDATSYAALITGRYGADGLPGLGHLSAELNPNIDYRDLWHVYEQQGYPDLNHPFGETYPNEFVGGLFGSSMDMHGRYTIGIPQVGGIASTPIARPTIDGQSNFTEPANEIASSHFEFGIMKSSRYMPPGLPNVDVNDDRPFTAKELERVIRPYDRDKKMLPDRLERALNGNLVNPQAITTDSYEVPALPSFEDPLTGNPISIVDYTYGLLTANGLAQPVANQQLEILLAPEVRMGLPLDLNRPFGNGRDDNANPIPIADEAWQPTDGSGIAIPGAGAFNESSVVETTQTVTSTPVPMDTDGDGFPVNSHLARANFARHLFVLALLASGDTADIVPDFANEPLQGPTARRVKLAQWAINVVEFRDPDSIRTPFEFDINPFNGWEVDGWLGPGPAGDDTLDPERWVVWGVERPELLISEALVTHDRRTEENTSTGDFENQLVPRASAHIELYHPHNQNDSNQYMPPELLNGSGRLDLKQTVPGSLEPVWRFVVLRDTSIGVDADNITVPEADVARKIYFVPPVVGSDPLEKSNLGSGRAFTGPKVFWSSFVGHDGTIDRGGFAVIGSSGVGTDAIATDGVTFFGRRTGAAWASELDQTRRINLDGPNREVIAYHPEIVGSLVEQYETRPNVAAIVIDQPRSLGLSDPDDGYASYGTQTEIEDGFQFDIPPATSADESSPYALAVFNDGVSDGFSSLYLQRLANPLAPYDPVTNPYLTIDAKLLDLISFNGVEDDSAATNYTVNAGDMVFAAAERGRLGDPLFGPAVPAQNRRWLWKQDEGGINLSTAVTQPHFQAVTDNHVHSRNLYDTLGAINGCWTDSSTPRFPRPATDLNSGAFPPMPFTGLAWNNRPFAGHMDLLEVPHTTGFGLLDEYSPYDPFASTGLYNSNQNIREFGHLPNFFVDDDPSWQGEPRKLYAVLDFVRVPTRFSGTRDHLPGLSPPFNVVSKYREPGKINLNTLPDLRVETTVWTGLTNVFSSGINASGALMDGTPQFYGSNPIDVTGTGFEGARRGLAGTGIAVFDNPFRTANEFAKVPPGGNLLASAVDATSLRDEVANVPIFDYPVDTTSGRLELPYANPSRDSFSRHEVHRLLANTTTTRSSVFAVWVTVGKFEVDENGFLRAYDDGSGAFKLQELGFDTGRIERSRGFFMIDRSIPVGFEPGKNHNIENMILTETIIQ